METPDAPQWRTSVFYDGDVAWFNGVLYRIKMATKHKYHVAHGGHFYRQWYHFGTALSRKEAEAMCEAHAEAAKALQELRKADTVD